MKKLIVSIFAMAVCFTAMSATALAATPVTSAPETTYEIPLQGYISDADGTIVAVIDGKSNEIVPRYAPVARTFTLSAGQTFTSYQYAGSAYDWIGGEVSTFSQGSSVNLKVQRATSVGGSRTTALNTTLRADDADGASLSTSQYGNIIYTNTSSGTVSFYGYVIINDR